MTSPAGDAVVAIERLEGVYRVAADHPAPAAVRGSLDRLVRTRLEEACARTLTPILDPGDPSIWLIRDVDVELAVNAAAANGDVGGEDAVVAAWAAQIADGVRALIMRGPDGDRVIRFRDRADLIATYLTDVSRGAVRDWHSPDFDGLRLLSPSRAMREALVREPDQIAPVLSTLAATRRLDPVLDALSHEDAEAVCAALDAGAESGDPPIELAHALEALAAPAPWTALGAGAADRLRAWAEGGSLDSAGPSIAAVLERIAQVGSLFAVSLASADEVLAALGRGDVESALALAGEHTEAQRKSCAWLAAAVAARPALLEEARSALARGSAAFAPTNGCSELLASACTGAFLLLEPIAELGLGEPQHGALRALIALKCLPAHPRDALRDPGFRVAFGLDDDAEVDELAAEAADPAALIELSANFLRTALDRGWVGGEQIVADVADTSGGVVVVLRDPRRDIWVFAGMGQYSVGRGHELVSAALGAPPELFAARPGAAVRLGLPLADPDAEHARRAKPLGAELDFLALAGVPQDIDLFVSLLAHAALRQLAARLPGLRWSGARHLAANVLAGGGTVRISDESVDVRLSSRPLDVVIGMAGLHEAAFRTPWLDKEIRIEAADT